MIGSRLNYRVYARINQGRTDFVISQKHLLVGLLALLVALPGRPVQAASEQFDYPELSVVPRASDRLENESHQESRRRLWTFLPIQVSGAMTAVAGLTMYDSPTNTTPGLIGMSVGGAWILTGTALSLLYSPYGSVAKEISALPKGSVREQLTRERRAEEELKYTAMLMNRVKWLSVATNLGAGVYMVTQRGALGSTYNNTALTLGTTIATMAFSVLPIAFKTYWEQVWDQQHDYKKRIFAPVASATIFTEPVTRAAAPGLMLSLAF